MSFRTLFAILLGLAFQLAQVAPALNLTSSCQAETHACCCSKCQGASCPCAAEAPSNQKPSPAPILLDPALKDFAFKPADPRIPGSTTLKPLPPVILTDAATRAPGPFAGVRIAVAYCSMVI